MKTIGLVGGVASGKSLVARMLEELGAGLLDADRAGHDVLENDPDVRRAVVERWGDGVIAADGRVDRRAVASHVFSGNAAETAERQFLEGLLHPRIRQRIEALAEGFAAAGRAAVVLDAPLLLEAGWGPMCNVILCVDAPRAARLSRAQGRGWDDAELAHREAAQWPVEKKRQQADVVLVNDGTPDELREAVERFWAEQVAGGR